MSTDRKVIIKQMNGVIYVAYKQRTKGLRYNAAQFDPRYNSVAKVEQWIKDKRGISL
tara:strand:- start:315 stop:485 length:171 start_codon:yes stop_codon:yes gene_type:complete